MNRIAFACVSFAFLSGTASAQAPASDLPEGIIATESQGELIMATPQGRPYYTLDIDRVKDKASRRPNVIMLRCGDLCSRYWKPVPAPASFRPDANWTVAQGKLGTGLAFKGRPIYTFEGNDVSVLAATPVGVMPPYLLGYTGEPARIEEGVATESVYWHKVGYTPPAPAVALPSGFKLVWAKKQFVYATAAGQALYLRPDGKQAASAGMTVEAPMAAHAVGDWAPMEFEGRMIWSRAGQPVYTLAQGASPDAMTLLALP